MFNKLAKRNFDIFSNIKGGKNLFFEENHKDPYLQINLALKYGGINEGYKLISL